MSRWTHAGLVLVALGCGDASSSPDESPWDVRRLTGAEFDNSIRDVLATSDHAAAGFPPEASVDGFVSTTAALTYDS